MSELELSPQEQRARERVAALSRPEADHAFRERLQADFTRGQVGTRREIVLEPPRRAAWRWARGRSPSTAGRCRRRIWPRCRA